MRLTDKKRLEYLATAKTLYLDVITLIKSGNIGLAIYYIMANRMYFGLCNTLTRIVLRDSDTDFLDKSFPNEVMDSVAELSGNPVYIADTLVSQFEAFNGDFPLIEKIQSYEVWAVPRVLFIDKIVELINKGEWPVTPTVPLE